MSLTLTEKHGLQLALLKHLDLQEIKLVFHELALEVDSLETKSREALAYDLVNFSTRPQANDQLARLLEFAHKLNSAFEWPPKHFSTLAKVFMVAPRNDYFTAREVQLKRITNGLAQQKVMAVCGLGGMGKTQTLVEYAHQQRAGYSAVLWFGAESVESLNAGWLSAAQKLDLVVTEQDIAVIRQQVIQRLQAMAGWLLVFDNVDDLALVRDVVGALKAYGHVLLSTRVADTRPVAEPVYLDKMSSAEGMDFLTKRTGLAADASAEELVRVLDGLPLALEQAAAYIAGGKSFARYLELYQNHEVKLLDKRGDLSHSTDHPDPVVKTWLLSF